MGQNSAVHCDIESSAYQTDFLAGRYYLVCLSADKKQPLA